MTCGSADDRSGGSFGDAIKAHRARVAEVLPTGDAAEIKRLYVELGELLNRGGDDSDIPPLSFPEIGPVIGVMSESLCGRVLDAGCGPNPVFSIMLGARDGRTIISLDISPGIVRLAVDRARKAGVDVFGVVGDLEALPFRDGVIDGCVCEDTIEHVPDDMKGASELARVLRPGGRLILGTPNRVRLDVIVRKVRDRFRGERRPASDYYAATSHLREYTWTALERVVAPWFTVKDRVTVGWSNSVGGRIASVLVERWPLRWFGRMVIMDLEPRKPA